jgi:hypothetical protein
MLERTAPHRAERFKRGPRGHFQLTISHQARPGPFIASRACFARGGEVPEELDLVRQRPRLSFGPPRPDIGLAVEPRPFGGHEPGQPLGHGHQALGTTAADRHLLHRPELTCW